MTFNEIEKALNLRSRAVLILPSIGLVGNLKTDKAASERMVKAEGADKAAAEVRKTLVDPALLKPLARKRDEMRTYYKAMTSCWNDGEYVLSSALATEFFQHWDELTAQFNELADDFAFKQFPVALAAAAKRLGALYNAADYPTPGEVREKCYVEIDYRQLPETSDWRLDAPEAIRQRVANSINADATSVLHDMADDLRERLISAVDRLATQLDGGKLFDSLTGDLDKACKVALATNLANDQKLASMAELVNRELNRYTVDDYREDKALRQIMANRAKEILDQLRPRAVMVNESPAKADEPQISQPIPAPAQLELAAGALL